MRNYGDNKIYRIAGGPNVDDYNWTEVLMREAAEYMDGLSVHYYVHAGPNGGGFWDKGSALDFSVDEWDMAMQKTYHTEELIEKHSTIMDKYDPEKRIGMIFDEWGAWHDVEPGTNPGFLYQQNSVRDALIAGVSLNIFNNHNDRVQMANIAQTINVFQAMILTDKEKMILTPTYHVFEMYKVHQDAERIHLDIQSDTLKYDDKEFPQVSGSASKANDGTVNISLCNVDKDNSAKFTMDLRGMDVSDISGRILTDSKMNAHNTFEQPDNVAPTNFTGFTVKGNELELELPAKSVVVLAVK